MLKIISVSLLSIGLASSALAQTSQNSASDPTNKVNPGPMHAPQATDGTTTNSVRTNCAPNQQTNTTASMPDKTGSTNVTPGESGANTNGQSSNC